MNNIYTILGLGLLSAAALSSCQQEEIFKGENNDKLPEGTLSTIATISDYAPENGNSRANVQEDGKTFYWNTNDKVTIWDGTKAIEFSANNYDEAKPSNNVEFTAEGEFADGATVWGVYPSKGSDVTADNVFSFTLSDEIEQTTDGQPHLNNTMFMLAEGKVSGQTVTNLNFKHLTSVFHFTIQNNTSDNYAIKSIEVQAFNADGSTPANVFPKELKINGTEKTYSSLSNTLSLKLNDINLAYSNKTTAYLSFFPSQGLTADSKLKIVAKVNKNSEGESELVLKEGSISELYKDKSLTTTDNNNYVEGKRYGVTSAIINPNDMGYIDNGDGVYTIITAQGLVNAISGGLFGTATTINLQNDLDMSVIEASIEPIATFNGTFNGNNKTISNLSISNESNKSNNSNGIGLFAENSGTIKNLIISQATITKKGTIAADLGVGVLAGVNKGKIENCTIQNPTITVSDVTKTSIGGLVGVNTGNGNITGCAVTSVNGNNASITLESTASQACDLGGLAGKSQKPISYSYVGSNVTINYNAENQKDSNIGGLIGFCNNTTITGCYAKASIESKATTVAVSIGGLIGSAWTGNGATTTIKGSYSAGSITTPANITTGTIGTFIGNGSGAGTKNISYCYTSTTKTYGKDFFGNGVTINASYSYFISDSDAAENIDTGYKAITVNTLKGKVDTFNTALSWGDYEFATSESNTEPLVIVKK